jgi:ATP synthase protein I
MGFAQDFLCRPDATPNRGNSMRNADVQLRRSARSVTVWQLILVVPIAASLAIWSGPAAGMAALFGGFAVGLGTALHAWKLSQAIGPDGSLDVAAFYQGALLKVLATVALLAIGLVILRLNPVAMIGGVTAAYMALLFTRSYAPRYRKKPEQTGNEI